MKAISQQTQFILARAACLLVEAYSKCITEYQTVFPKPLDLSFDVDAPNTHEALLAGFKEGKLRVSTEHNESSIYGYSGNITFRIFHDMGHLLYGAAFTTEQEVSLAQTQWKDLERYLPKEWVSVCYVVYRADTVEQSLYEAHYGTFPADQKAFVREHLAARFEGRMPLMQGL